MKWKKVILFTSAIAGAGAGAYFLSKYFATQKKLLSQYKVELLGIKFSSFTQELITIEFTLRVNNFSDIEATVKKLNIDIILNDVAVGNIVNNCTFLIPARKSPSLPGYSDTKLSFSFSSKILMQNIVGTFLDILKNKDVVYVLKGKATLQSGFVVVKLPINYTGGLKSDLLGK